MAIADIATTACKKFVLSRAKKLRKKEMPFSLESRPSAFVGDSYACGFAMREVMPADITAKTYWMAGYRMGNKIVGVYDPMTVRAMWVGCGDGGVVLVSADCVGLTGYDVGIIRDSLADFKKESGCSEIIVSCTHTHAGIDTVGYWGKLPRTGRNEEYMQQLFAAIKDICIEAWQNKKSGKLFVGDVHVPGAIKDGREPIVVNDRLTRLRFVPNDGSDETWYMNYGAHTNTMGGGNSKVSADYPYFMREQINKSKKVNVLFSVNAIAAVNINDLSEDRYERTKLGGEMLGDAALTIDNDTELAPEIFALAQPYLAPVDNYVLGLMGIIHVCTTKMALCTEGALGMALVTELDYLRLGSLQLLTLPGEAMPEFVYGGYSNAETSATGKGAEINTRTLTEIAGDDKLLVFGVTNDMTGYIVPHNDFILHPTQAYLSSTRDKFDRNHYHETNSLGYLTTDVIARTFEGMMDKVNKSKKA